MDWLCPTYTSVLGQQLQKYHGKIDESATINHILPTVQTGDLHVAFRSLSPREFVHLCLQMKKLTFNSSLLSFIFKWLDEFALVCFVRKRLGCWCVGTRGKMLVILYDTFSCSFEEEILIRCDISLIIFVNCSLLTRGSSRDLIWLRCSTNPRQNKVASLIMHDTFYHHWI